MTTKIRAMIIDGSYTNRILYKALLEEFDFEVSEACNTIKAMHLFNEVNPQIIILDISKPLANGFGFLDYITILKKDVPVIVVSVYDDQQIIREAYSRGASEFLVKPIDKQQLAEKLSQYIECVF